MEIAERIDEHSTDDAELWYYIPPATSDGFVVRMRQNDGAWAMFDMWSKSAAVDLLRAYRDGKMEREQMTRSPQERLERFWALRHPTEATGANSRADR